jgi:hypothetical protein
MADKINIFSEKMNKHISPGSSAKELVEKIVRSALEAEFGTPFTLSPGFDKMVSKLANVVVTNPDLRRQALQVASGFIENKMRNIMKKPVESTKFIKTQILRTALPINDQHKQTR